MAGLALTTAQNGNTFDYVMAQGSKLQRLFPSPKAWVTQRQLEYKEYTGEYDELHVRANATATAPLLFLPFRSADVCNA